MERSAGVNKRESVVLGEEKRGKGGEKEEREWDEDKGVSLGKWLWGREDEE